MNPLVGWLHGLKSWGSKKRNGQNTRPTEKEKQFNRRVKINTELRRLNQEIEELTR